MQAARAQFAVRFLPSLTDFAILMPVAFLFGRMNGVKSLLGDCDTGWHIRAGEWILANHRAPTLDMFSFTKPGQPWFAWEWLSEILFAKLHTFGGLHLIVMFSILLLAGLYGALYLLMRQRSSPVVATAVLLVTVACSSIHWLARPHLFTLLFQVFFYAILHRVSQGRTRIAGIPALAILPVLTAVWANLHSGFVVGIVMAAAYGAGELCRAVFLPGGDWRREWEKARPFLLCAGACTLASLINPYTYHLYTHMAEFLRDPWKGDHILEYFSPNFHHPMAPFLETLLVLVGATIVWNVRHGRFTEPLLMALWAHGSLLAVRNIPILAIAAAPPVAAAVEQWVRALPELNLVGWMRRGSTHLNRILSETTETDAMPRLHLVSIGGLALIAAVIYAPHPPKKFRSEFDPQFYPAAALRSIAQQDARIFTDDEWGDYLIYMNRKVFLDGRVDFYGTDFEKKCNDVMNARYGWEQTLERYGVDTVLLQPSSPLAGALKESSKWRVSYDDGMALVFRPAAKPAVEVAVAAAQGDVRRGPEIAKPVEGDRGAGQGRPRS
jgi:hypothetical protein